MTILLETLGDPIWQALTITPRPGCYTRVRFSVCIPKAQTIAAWERYTSCNMPGQSGDPAAWTILTLTLAPGFTERFGRSGDIDYRFTMSDQDNVWTISGMCTIMSEGCIPIDWGATSVKWLYSQRNMSRAH